MALKFALCLVSILCLLQASNSQSSEFTFDGWDVVFLDTPANLYSIHHSHTQELLYVFGGTELRLINTGANFAAQPPVDAVEWHQPYISIHVFHNGSDIWAAGPTTPSDYTAQTDGYDLPLALTGPGVYQTQKVPGLQGFILYNVFVDHSNPQDVLAYMVGWIPTIETTLNSVSLGLVRVHVDLTQPFASRNYHFNYSVDVLPLSSNKFTVYNSFYKPHIHYSNASNTLIIVDPFNNNVFTVTVGPGTTPLVKAKSALISKVNMTITSSIYHPETSFLYVGYAAQGTGGGAIAAMDIGTLTSQIFVNFGPYQSNPRALVFDDDIDTMYVGFSGGDVVIKMDYLLNTKGYQRVPPYFTSLEAGQVGLDHIYFITNEQHSKVVRVNKTDFCTNLCPFNGYCQAGQCQCYRHYSLSKDGASCEITENDTTIIEKIKEKGAEVALGVLFALTLIVGVVGWVLFWRARKGGYQSV